MYYLFVGFFLLLIIEIFLSFKEEIALLGKYKKLHCLEESYLFLCPNKNFSFKRKDNQFWKVTTNTFGERITLRTKDANKYEKENWFIGDSISFGYLVSDENTAPYLLDLMQEIPVRNLGVDSLGSLGIEKRLKESLKKHKNTKIENLFWIYNTSDFLDDQKEMRNFNSSFYKIFYRTHYFFGRYSNIYNALIFLKKDIFNPKVNIPEINVQDVEDDHITFKNIRNLIEFILSNNQIKNFIVIIYPGMNINTKKADIHSKVTEKVYKFFKENYINILDLREEFHNSKKNPYFEFDGHPNEYGYQIIANSLISFLKQK